MKKMNFFHVVSILITLSMLLIACGTKNVASNTQNETTLSAQNETTSSAQNANSSNTNEEGFKRPDGTLVKNEWVKFDDKYYFYDENGKLVKDSYVENDYYVDKDGVMVRNTWHKDKNSGKYYYYCDDGKYEKDHWVKYNNDWFYLDNTGAMVTNKWVEDLYYVDNEGKMLKDTITPDGYYVDANGRYRSQQELNQIFANIASQQAKIQQAKKSKTVSKAVTQIISSSPLKGTPYLGQHVVFGEYQGEPISWVVIDAVPGKALLLSSNMLDFKKMSESFRDTTWDTSNLRVWLNNDFYYTAFANVNKSLIAATSVANTMNPKTTTRGGADTWDNVFLLSVSEVENYRQVLDNNNMFRPTYSEYANRIKPASHKGEWWLRTLGTSKKEMAYVESTGDINYNGAACDLLEPGVRPAIWIKY